MRTPKRTLPLCLLLLGTGSFAQGPFAQGFPSRQPPQRTQVEGSRDNPMPHHYIPPEGDQARAYQQQLQQQGQAAPPPPGAPPPSPANYPPPPGAPEREIGPQKTPTALQVTAGPTKKGATCEELRRNARFIVFFPKPVDIVDLVQTVANATCKTFILPSNINGKIAIIGPENGKGEVDADQFYAAFLAALDSNNLTVYPHGRFLKILEKRQAKSAPIPIVGADEDQFTTNEQMVTKIFKLKYAEVDPVRNAIQSLINTAGGGEAVSVQPDTLIVTDVADNIHRLEGIINQLDTKSSTDELRVVQIRYANAQDVANTIQKIFEQKGGKSVRSAGGPLYQPPPAPGGGPPPASGSPEAGGPVTLSQIIPDERTNKLIVMASPAAYSRIDSLIREIDVPISGEGRINVYNLSNANAEDMATTLQSLAQGTTSRSHMGGAPGAPPAPGGGAAQHGATTAELFSGEVKISADKATNALVIIANQGDYRNLARVIEKLDIPRRQVFVEAVIMEVNLDRKTQLGINLHQGFPLHTPEGDGTGIVGTNYAANGLPPSLSLANLANFGGFLAGIQGPAIPALQQTLGISIPSFGIILHALQTSSDVNILSTPHLLTSDNEEAEITVGQNIPFQAGFSPSSLGAAVPGLTGAPGTTPGAVNPIGLGLGLGGLSSLYAPIQRENVQLKLNIKPQINESEYVRLVIQEQTEEIASTDKVLGPSISKRSAKTTVVAKDQETVVIGGIMQEHDLESVSKVPVLGDLPIVGHLFRDTSHEKIKTNLLLFLTPYIIRDQTDFRRIFERKMAERQQFVEEFYGQVAGYDVPVDFGRKAGPLEKINQAVLREQSRAENGGPGLPGEQIIRPAGAAGATGAAAQQPPAGPMGPPLSQPPPAPPLPQGPEVQPPAPPGNERPAGQAAPPAETAPQPAPYSGENREGQPPPGSSPSSEPAP